MCAVTRHKKSGHRNRRPGMKNSLDTFDDHVLYRPDSGPQPDRTIGQ